MVLSLSLWGRSREGAWIEITVGVIVFIALPVAPVRERGLKFLSVLVSLQQDTVAPVRERGLKYI